MSIESRWPNLKYALGDAFFYVLVSRWTRRLLIAPFAILSPVIAARCVWHWRPSVWTAGILAFVFLLSCAARISVYPVEAWPVGLAALGGSMNLAVVMRNRGRMPVIGKREPGLHSVWVRANSRHRWLMLADRSKWYGFSVGDAVIGVALLVRWIA